MKPHHRTHVGWVDVVRGRPEIPGRVKRLLVDLVEFGTYRNKKLNQYSCTRARLANLLGIDERNVQRSLVAAVDRSVPWDHPRHWTPRPCPTCSWSPRRKGVRQGGENVSLNVSLNVSPISSTSEDTRARVLHIADPALANVRGLLAPLARVA
jgi:hypothetical protein